MGCAGLEHAVVAVVMVEVVVKGELVSEGKAQCWDGAGSLERGARESKQE